MPPQSLPDMPFDPRDRTSFRSFERVTLRFQDLDTLGHVNNIAFNSFVEQARVMFWRPFLAEWGNDRIDTIVVRVAVDYFAELDFPGEVEVGARVSRIGTKSLVLQSPVFRGGKCHALGESTIALFDKVERKTVAPPPEFRAALERQMREG
jgi:acyl-CoA thioester hydrolase